MATDYGTFKWPSAEGAGGGVTSLNTLTGDLLLVAGSAGTDFAISSLGTTITLNIPTASASNRGLLSSSDWSAFNAKQGALTIGNLTAVGTDGIAVTGGTGSVIGSGTSIAQTKADSTHNGYLSSTDWSTFNGKQGSGNYITALTGDGAASGPGSAALTLATVNSNVGSFGSASSVATFTVNAKGLTTAAASTSIQIAESQVTNLVSDLALKAPLASPTFTGTVNLTAGSGFTVSSVNSGATTLQFFADNTFTYGGVLSNGSAIFGTSGTGTTALRTNGTDRLTINGTTGNAVFTGAVTGSNLSGTNTGDQTITLTGNVTGSGTGSFATTIANAAVTPAMLNSGQYGGKYAVVYDSKTAGTDGGTFTQATWVTRDLNTEQDPDSIVSISTNQFTLAAGTYRIRAEAPAFEVSGHKAKLYNVTDAADVLIGTSAFQNAATVNAQGTSVIVGVFTISGNKAFEIRHYCQTTHSTNGLGHSGSGSGLAEIYTMVEIWKIK